MRWELYPVPHERADRGAAARKVAGQVTAFDVELVYLAERDALTGLYNRHRFQEELVRALGEAERRRACTIPRRSTDAWLAADVLRQI